jgi:hypothetical protein
MRRILFFLAVLCVSSTGLMAQKAKLKSAAKAMEELNYVSAIQLYNEVLDGTDEPEAKINIAEAYRKVGDTENAEFWYGQVVRLPAALPEHMLFYGQMLQTNGKCEMAREWYQKYVEQVPSDQRGQYLVRACDYEDELRNKNADIYQIRHLPFNSSLDDFAPALIDNALVFASERDKGSAVKRVHTWTGNPFLELFKVDKKDSDQEQCCTTTTFGRPEKYSKDINTKFHDAAISLPQDGKTIFFTRNNYSGGKLGRSDDGIVKLKVYYSSKSGEEWGEEQSLPFNSDEYSVAHPAVTQDGKRLFFASDMPGGYGGMDLYVSENENGRWGPPTNLGPGINTEATEIFPYYDKTGKLYFASDGHIGLGGLDVYYMEDKGDGTWGSIENVGFPVNTESDDFGLIFTDEGRCGYFASDRAGGFGRDDIYCFRKDAAPVEILVYDEVTGIPIEGAEVFDECTERTFTTNEEGKVTFEMKLEKCCNLLASKELYDSNSKEACTIDVGFGEPVYVEIALKKSMDCLIKGIVFDQSTGIPIEGVEVTLSNDCEAINPATVVTDANGFYEFNIAEECCYKVSAYKEEYFSSPITDQCSDCKTKSSVLQADIYMSPTTVSQQDPVIVLTPGTTTQPGEIVQADATGVYLDLNKCLYIDPDTGLPANIDTGSGVVYKEGYRYIDGVKQVPDCSGEYVSGKTGFEISPSVTYAEPGEPVPYLLHIYYDFDQYYIRDEAVPELEKLCSMLNENDQLIVEIGSHTDARGSHAYNQLLSQRRAESVVRWVSKQCGVNRKRLIPRGYGELTPVNNCVNKVPCNEKQHQLNRRTEFRIIGCVGETQVQVSKPKADPKVVPCEGCPF